MNWFFQLCVIGLGVFSLNSEEPSKKQSEIMLENVGQYLATHDLRPLVTKEGDVDLLGFLTTTDSPKEIFYPIVEVHQGEKQCRAVFVIRLDPTDKQHICFPLFFTRNEEPISVQLWEDIYQQIRSQLPNNSCADLTLLIEDKPLPAPFKEIREVRQAFCNPKTLSQEWKLFNSKKEHLFYVILTPDAKGETDFIILGTE